jgi:protein dithiol:quinone oxidoreductase
MSGSALEGSKGLNRLTGWKAWLQPPRLFWFIFLSCVAAVAAALASQHVFDMQPCPWCILQRLLFCVIALLALLGALLPGRLPRLATGGAIVATSLGGVAAALWQHNVAAQAESCSFTLAERWVAATGLDGLLPEVFATRASCADAAVKLLGLPYEFWSLGLFVLIAALPALSWRLRAADGPRQRV